MEMNNFPLPQNLEEVKGLFAQFEAFLPEDKREIIRQTLDDIEAAGGIRDEAHGRELLVNLLSALGMPQL